MNDHDLPDERRLDDATRARMRADLIAATAQPAPRRTSWLAPVAASVALLAVVGTTGALLAFGGGDSKDAREPAPAGSSLSSVETPNERKSTAPEPTDIQSGSSTEVLPPEGYYDPSSCEADVPQHLGNAREVAAIEYDGGRASMWHAGPLWVVCDTWAASDGGATTLVGDRAIGAPMSKETFRISENYSMDAEAGAQFFAAGPTIPEVTSIRYTFPDGHVAEAEITKRMWLMTYQPAGGPLADGGADLEPITVQVTSGDGQVDDYTLTWGLDTCAQINHGC